MREEGEGERERGEGGRERERGREEARGREGGGRRGERALASGQHEGRLEVEAEGLGNGVLDGGLYVCVCIYNMLVCS